MQITLTESELKSAVRAYVETMGITRPIGELKFVASRNDGIVTEIELSAPNEAPAPKPALVPRSAEAVAETVAEEPKDSESEAEPAEAPAGEEDEDDSPLPAGKSLFG